MPPALGAAGITLMRLGILGQVGAMDRGIKLAFAQHLQKVLVGRDPLDAGRLAVFGYMGVLLGEPTQPLGIDAIVAGKNAAHPDGRGLAVAKATRSGLMSPRLSGSVCG